MSEAKKLAKEAAGFIPGVGTAMDIASAGQAIASGNIPLAALETASAAVGLVPGIGRVLGKALKFTAKKTGLVKFTKEDILTKGDDNYKAIRGNVDESLDKKTAQEVFKSDDSKIEAIRKAQSKSRTMDVAGARPFKKEALQLEKDEITPKEFRKKAFADVEKFDNVEELPTYTEVVFSLDKNKRAKGIIGLDKTIPKNVKPLEAGDEVKARLDIPAYNRYDVYVPQITYKKPNAKGAESVFSRTMVIKDVTFGTSSKAAFDISRGVQQKFPHATINGTVATNPLTKKAFKDNEAHGIAKAVIDDDDFIHVGYNPDRGGFFYDRGTKMPIFKSPFVVQIGKQIFAKRPVETVAERTAKLRQLDLRSIRDRSGSSLKKGRPTLFNQGGLTTDEQTQQAFNQGGYGVAGKFTSDTGVSAAKEKGNFEGFGYKGEAKEAPAETKSFQESVDMSSGGDDDKKVSALIPAPFEKNQFDQYKKVNPKTYADLKFKQTDKDEPLGYMGKPTGQTLKQRQEEVKNVSLGETKEMAKARVKNSIFNKLSSLTKDDIFKDPKNISVRKTIEESNIESPLIQAVLESGYLINDVGNLDTFSFNEQTGEYSFNRNKLISNLTGLNPAHVKTINDFYLNATGAKTVEELDLNNPNSDWFWCSAFIHDILIKAGAKPLETYDSYDRTRARKYANYGTKVNSLSEAKSGDILLIGNPTTGEIGHLTFYVGPEIEESFKTTYGLIPPSPYKDYVLGLGGNQAGRSFGELSAEVNVKPFSTNQVLGIRRIEKVTPEMKNQLASDNPNYKNFVEGAVEFSKIPLKRPKNLNPYAGVVEFSKQPLSRPKEFNKGGINMEQQMSLFDEGGMKDDGLDRDPVSGNEIPPGSLAKEVRDDIPAQLSEGEYVVPADVVQYYGVKFFEDLRMEAKRGLAEMDATGRIGGEPMSMTMIAIGGAEEEQKERQKKALGGIVGFDNGGVAKDMAEIQKYGSYNPYDFSVVGGTRLSPIARTGQSMGLTTPDTHSKMFYHPDGRVQAVPGRMVTVNGEQKFLPNPQYIDFTTGEWSDTPPSQAKTQTTETPKEDRDDRGKSSFDFEAQRLQNENSLKVSAERLGLDPKVYAGLGFFKRFKLMGEEIKAMRGQEIDKDKINSIVNDADEGSSFDLRGILKAVTTFGFLATGNPLIPLAARIIAGISTDDDKKKDVKTTIKDPKTSKGVKSKSIVPTGSSGVDTSTIEGITKASGVTPKTTAKTKTPSAKAKETFREKEAKGLTKSIGTAGGSKTAKDFEDPSDNFAGMINKGGLINKPKRNPKKPRGKGLGSK